jgi:hypothetical protein
MRIFKYKFITHSYKNEMMMIIIIIIIIIITLLKPRLMIQS